MLKPEAEVNIFFSSRSFGDKHWAFHREFAHTFSENIADSSNLCIIFSQINTHKVIGLFSRLYTTLLNKNVVCVCFFVAKAPLPIRRYLVRCRGASTRWRVFAHLLAFGNRFPMPLHSQPQRFLLFSLLRCGA